jgi:hypothetical protein
MGLTKRWSRRRAVVLSSFQMTRTVQPQATRALARTQLILFSLGTSSTISGTEGANE